MTARTYMQTVLLSADQFFNTLAGGNPDMTVSSHVEYMVTTDSHPKRYWRMVRWIINATFYPLHGHGHCAQALANERDPADDAGSDLTRLVLTVFVIAFCALMFIPLWVVKLMSKRHG